MKQSHLILGAVVAAGAIVLMSRKAPVAQTTSGYVTNLNSSIYNPFYNPGGQTNYIGTFLGQGPATGYGPAVVSYGNAPGIYLPTSIR